MAELISNTSLNVSKILKDATKTVLNKKVQSNKINRDTASKRYEALIKKIEGSKAQLTAVPEFKELSKISSESLQTFFDSVAIDLTAIYNMCLNIEAVDKQFSSAVSLDLSKLKTNVQAAYTQYEVFKFLKANPEYQDYKIINFIDMVNNSQSANRAVVDPETRKLELPTRVSEVVIPSNDPRTIYSTVVHGGVKATGIGDSYFKPEYVGDSNPSNFWYESYESETTIQHIYQTSWAEYEAFGPVVDFVISFPSVNRLNNIKISPYCGKPYNIIDVCYRENKTGEWRTVPKFKIVKDVDYPVELSFEPIAAVSIKVVIEQPHYTKHIDSIPEEIVKNNYLFKIYKDTNIARSMNYLLTDGGVDSTKALLEEVEKELDISMNRENYLETKFSRYEDFVKYITANLAYLSGLDPSLKNELSEIVSGKKEFSESKSVSVSYYEYSVGIESIEILSNVYSPIGEYESDELITSGSILQIELESDDEHTPSYEDGIKYNRTSVEYQVEVSPGTVIDIHPINKTLGEQYVVEDEYLNITNGSGKLRFTPIAPSFVLRKNGERLDVLDYAVSGRDITILNHDARAVYTISYKVGPEATTIDTLDRLNLVKPKDPEKHPGTDVFNSIRLNNYPFVILEIIKDKIKWSKDRNSSLWNWNPQLARLSRGLVNLTQGSTLVTLTKDSVSDLGFTSLTLNDKLKLWCASTGETLDIDESIAATDTTIRLKNPYEGVSVSTRFIIGQAEEYYGDLYGLSNTVYSPVRIFVEGVECKNVTDYSSNRRPVFSGNSDNEIQFIHSGKNIYFNKPIERDIKVVYNYLTSYIKVKAKLRSNILNNQVYTPKINSINLRLITTEL